MVGPLIESVEQYFSYLLGRVSLKGQVRWWDKQCFFLLLLIALRGREDNSLS